MQLHIFNPDSYDFCEAVGISPERQRELSLSLDAMAKRLDSGPVHLAKMHDTFAEITSLCHTEAEIIYCTILHCGWQYRNRRGRLLAPGPLDHGTIARGLAMLSYRLREDDSKENLQILKKLETSNEVDVIKEGAREGVQRLINVREFNLAQDIINYLTGFAF